MANRIILLCLVAFILLSTVAVIIPSTLLRDYFEQKQRQHYHSLAVLTAATTSYSTSIDNKKPSIIEQLEKEMHALSSMPGFVGGALYDYEYNPVTAVPEFFIPSAEAIASLDIPDSSPYGDMHEVIAGSNYYIILAVADKEVPEEHSHLILSFNTDLKTDALSYATLTVSATALVLILLVTWLIRQTFSPMRKISSALEDIAQGNIGKELPVSGTIDIENISSSINQITATLQTQTTELSETKESLEKMEFIYQNSTDAIIEVTPEGYVLQANKTAQKLFPDIIQKGLSHDLLQNFSSIKEACIDGNQRCLSEVISGENAWQQNCLPARLQEMNSVIIFISDVTKIKLADLTLRRYGVNDTNQQQAADTSQAPASVPLPESTLPAPTGEVAPEAIQKTETPPPQEQQQNISVEESSNKTNPPEDGSDPTPTIL